MRKFTIESAEDILPEIKRFTAAAATAMEELVHRMRDLAEDDPDLHELDARGRRIAGEWFEAIKGRGAEPKGLWLVDFDSGDGYLCWQYPEESIEFFHSYEAGFAGREPIPSAMLH